MATHGSFGRRGRGPRAPGARLHAGRRGKVAANVAAHRAVSGRIGAYAEGTHGQAHEAGDAAGIVQRHAPGEGVAAEGAALAGKGAQRLQALFTAERFDAVAAGGQNYASYGWMLFGDGGLQRLGCERKSGTRGSRADQGVRPGVRPTSRMRYRAGQLATAA